MNPLNSLCEFLSDMWQCGLAIVDVETYEILYVTSLFTKETSISNEDVALLGKNIYKKHLHPHDYDLVTHIHHVFLNFFKNHKKVIVTYNVRLKKANGCYENYSILIKFTELQVCHTHQRMVGLIMCQPEVKFGFEKFSIYLPDKNGTLYYCCFLDKFVERDYLEFRKIEKDILALSASGHTETKIAKSLGVKIDLIRYYKKCIYKKLYTSNMSEAIYTAIKLKLI
jgi:DNA-binding CsgD family transcriptional regulator